MSIDHHRLVQIATELKEIDRRKERLLAELSAIAGGGTAAAPRRGRPARSSLDSRLDSRLNSRGTAEREPNTPSSHRRRRRGLTKAIIDLLESTGAAYTAGDIVTELKLPKKKSQLSTVSTTLVRLAKEGRVKKDEERGYLVG